MAKLGYIQVTRRCNQHCHFCSNPPAGDDLTIEQGERWIAELAALGYQGVAWTGGEPTLGDSLPALIADAAGRGLRSRLITNGQLLAEGPLLDRLLDAGLDHLHLSVYSHRPEVQAELTQNPRALLNLLRTLERIGERAGRVRLDLNTVICRQNADHLHRTAGWFFERFPFIRHQVWNNLDAGAGRAAGRPDTHPRLAQLEVSLHLAMRWLGERGCTFRVERVPLCYMAEHAECSTETRKIVRQEERAVFFLDRRGLVEQRRWRYQQAACCRVCRLEPVCAGLAPASPADCLDELFPVFVDAEQVRSRVLGGAAVSRPPDPLAAGAAAGGAWADRRPDSPCEPAPRPR